MKLSILDGMQQEQQMDMDWLTRPTGDVFADTGGIVIEELRRQRAFADLDILSLITQVAKFYVNEWGSGQISPFFLNSAITQPSYKPPKKISETTKYFQALLIGEDGEMGFCRLLGEETLLFPAGRNNQVLAGSGTYVNFHHLFDMGTRLSAAALIRMFFVPLGSTMLMGKLAVVSSPNRQVAQRFVQENVREHLGQMMHGGDLATGICRSRDRSPETALINLAKKLIRDTEDLPDTDIQLYRFTNFSASPEVAFHYLKHPVYRFIRKVNSIKLRSSWQPFAHSFFVNSELKQLIYDEGQDQYEGLTKKERVQVNVDDFSHWHNRLYYKLIRDQNILYDMGNWTRKRAGKQALRADVAFEYAKIVRNMTESTIRKIKDLATFLVRGEDDVKIKQRLNQLLKARKQYQIRDYVLRMVKENYQEGNPEPLLTLEEFVKDLFPSSVQASDMRQLLLIAIYEQLHEKGVNVEVEEEEPIDESEN